MNEDMKYELIIPQGDPELTIYSYNQDIPLYRIRALKDFDDIKSGDIGGFVQSEDNLSQFGNCWIYEDAIVYQSAKVKNNAKIGGKSTISGNSIIGEDSVIGRHCIIEGYTIVKGKEIIKNNSRIRNNQVF